MITLDIIKCNLPGALLSVSQSGEAIKHYHNGLSDIGDQVPMQPQLLFHIGHITRTFTAAILLNLVEDGCLGLDSPLEVIAKHNTLDGGRLHIIVDQYPYLKPITVRELLNHTSGIPSYDKTLRYQKMFCEKPKKVWQAEGYLDLITRSSTHYQAGYVQPVRGFYSDSSTNYIIAGLVLEAVTGGRSSDNMQDLFMALGLNHTYYSPHGVLNEDLLVKMAHGYLPISHPFVNAFKKSPIYTYNDNRVLQVYDVTGAYNFNGLGGSACLSTTTDLIHWFQQLLKGKVLTSTIKDMFNVIPVSLEPSNKEDKDFYGLGIFKTLCKRYGEIVWSVGNNYGYSVLVAYALEHDICFALAVNSSRRLFNLHQEGIVQSVIKQLLP